MEEQSPSVVFVHKDRETGNGTASHLCGSLVNLIFPFFSWVVPLILYSSNTSEDTILKHHLAQSLNASLTFTLALLVHTALMVFCLGFITVLVHWIFYLVWSVNANNALKAGQMYNYPFTINFVNP